ncbi:MAG: hypothetical protein ACXWC8_13610 [Limisphaerales bacterium]
MKVTHPAAPVSFLFYHAMELYLKAFLLSQSLSLGSLKAIGHRLDKAGEKAIELGLALMDEDKEVLDIIGDSDTVINARYIVTGAFSRPAEEALSRTCLSLDNSVGKNSLSKAFQCAKSLLKFQMQSAILQEKIALRSLSPITKCGDTARS